MSKLLNRQLNRPTFVIPDVIRDPATVWIPAFAGMTVIAVFSCRVNNIGNYTKGSWRVNTIHADEINTCHAINNSF